MKFPNEDHVTAGCCNIVIVTGCQEPKLWLRDCGKSVTVEPKTYHKSPLFSVIFQMVTERVDIKGGPQVALNTSLVV